MISFFPTPYRGELLYSVLSRFHVRSSNISFASTMEDLYGKSYVNAVIDLPSNINTLVNNMPFGNEYTSDYFIKRYTLYNYYAAFLEDEKAQEIFNIMKSGKGSGIHSKVGAVPGISEVDKYYKLCPKCYEEDISMYGEGYLYRLHQTPGVIICPKHQELLLISKEPISFIGRNAFINVMDLEFKDNKYLGSISNREIGIFTELANDIEYLLNTDVSHKTKKWFVTQYKTRLMELGLCTINGIVDINEVFVRFTEFYGDNLLKTFNFNIYAVDKTNWIKYLLRNQNYVVHPLKHILLSRFLSIKIDELFNKKLEYKPFGYGEWPCLNKVCSNYLKPTIKEVAVKYNSHAKKPVGEFKCDCGFTYQRIGPDKCEDDKYKVGKVKELGWLWEQKLTGLLQKGVSLNAIEKKLSTSQNTIKKYAAKLGFNDYLNSRCKIKNDLDQSEKEKLKLEKRKVKIEEFRLRWIKLREENPEKSITELRMIDVNVQDYLLKNDREWLYNNYPPKKKRITGGAVVDWNSKDEAVLEKVRRAVNDIKNSKGRPKKITITLIGKKIGMSQFLYSNINRMPKTREFIENAVDTNKSYQVKKVEWAVQELIKEKEGVVWWKVCDMAGLNEISEFRDDLKNIFFKIKY